MDDSDVVQRCRDKAKEWIYQKSYHKYTIEDDEILDLDSLSLGSDDDTWLYSSDENSQTSIKITPCEEKNSCSISSFLNDNSASLKFDNIFDSTSIISPLSPLIDLNNCSDSLIHLPDVSSGALDNFFTRTPFEDRKSKPLIKTALCNQFRANHINIEEKNELESVSMKYKTEFNAFHKFDDTSQPSCNETISVLRKNRPTNEISDRSYILHSVENKLFTITDAADNNDAFSKTSQNRDPRIQKIDENCTIPSALNDNSKSIVSPTKATDFSNTKEHDKKLLHNKLAKLTPENDENDHRSAVKKSAPICQSTPMLLGRYLKYNKSIDDSKNFFKWRTSAEFLKTDVDEFANVSVGQHPMNVSYIKDTSPLAEDSPVEHNNAYSKLNSTYDVQEDDQTSSASESSVSSFGSKPTYSLQDVQKNAELQERNLKQQFHSNYGPGSSKSSEISSSNESISAFSPISSSNEGYIDAKSNDSYRNASKLSYPGRRPHTAGNHLANSNVRQSAIQKKKFVAQEKSEDHAIKVALGGNNDMFKSKLAIANLCVSPRNRQLQNKYDENAKNVSNFAGTAITETNSQLSTKIRETSSVDGSPNVQNVTFTSKLTLMKTTRNNSPCNEQKPSGDQTKTVSRRSASPGPASHIPRPSSRIPKLRSSSSCTRYSNFNSLKK